MKKTLCLFSLCLLVSACDLMPVSQEEKIAADTLTQKGFALLEAKYANDSLPYFEQAIAKDSKQIRAYQGKGIALNQLGRHQEAEAAYEAALAIDKDNIGIINNLALSHVFRGDYDGAITYLEPQSRTEPVHAKLVENLALSYCMKGEEEKARKLYKTRLPAAKIDENIKFCKQFKK